MTPKERTQVAQGFSLFLITAGALTALAVAFFAAIAFFLGRALFPTIV